jgi:hypothetical protein
MKFQLSIQVLLLAGGIGGAGLLSGCNKTSFSPLSLEGNSSLKLPDVNPPLDIAPPPAEPLPEEQLPPAPMPDPSRKAGACADQQSVNSCLKCDVPVDPPPPPVMSTKAEKLAQIMSMSCQIYNKSYPTPYIAPTPAEIRQQLIACSPALYPETPMTAAQTSLINSLLDPADDRMRKKMFKGLWYQPPYSEQFALYFGLENITAAYGFCMRQPVTGPLITEEYFAAHQGNMTEQWRWEQDPQAQARWRAAQLLRSQLLSCLNKPGTAVPPAPTTPVAHGCEYKSFEGYYEIGGRDEIATNLAQGFKVSIETGNSCTQLTAVPNVEAYTGIVKIGAVKCH